MNLADQIEAIARTATTHVVDASNEFSVTQRRLTQELAEYQDGAPGHGEHESTDDDRDHFRSHVDHEAEATGSVLPRLLVPADMAEANPHQPREERIG